jgi:tetratricopeptide (TPR) repeat protein
MFASFRSRRAARRAEELFLTAGFEAAADLLDSSNGLRGEPWAHFAVALYNRDRPAEAERAVRRALALEPGRGDALIFLAELLTEQDRATEAIETYRELLGRFPQAADQALALARLLLARDDFAGVRDLLGGSAHPSHEALLVLAQAHFALDEHQAVVSLLGPAVERLRLDLKQGMFGAVAQRDLYADYQEASHLYADAYAALHGREKVIESAVIQGDLDPHSGANYRLLGEARMAHAPSWTPDLLLRSVEEGRVFGQALIKQGETSRGLCQVGLSRLRQGKLDDARKLFRDARDADDESFVPYLGLAAVLDLSAARAFPRLQALPEPPVPAGIERVVTDWSALTPAERKVVTLIVSPLAGVLPRLAEAGARARILPIDARLTDLPEMAAGAGERAEDHRCLEAITGAATERVSASKIEELLCLTGERDSVFAHEFAHLAHFHLPEAQQRAIDELYERALGQQHVATEYQTTNSAEFFAVAYTDFIAHKYDLPSRRHLDEEGIVEATFALIRTFGA